MVFIIKQILTLFKVLHSENSEKQVALAVVFGLIVSLNPVMSLQGVLALGVVLFFRIQMGAFFLSWLLLSILTSVLMGSINQIGHSVLSKPSLRETFISMQKNDVLAFSRFNNSAVMGGIILSLILALPVYFIVKLLLKTYRDSAVAYFTQTKLFYFLKSSPLFKVVELYGKYKI